MDYINKVPIRLLQYIINMLDGMDQLHMRMTCKKYRLKLFITKPLDILKAMLSNSYVLVNISPIDIVNPNISINSNGELKIATVSYDYCFSCCSMMIESSCIICKVAYCEPCEDDNLYPCYSCGNEVCLDCRVLIGDNFYCKSCSEDP